MVGNCQFNTFGRSNWSDDCIGETLTVTMHHWLSVYAILTQICMYPIANIEHSLFTNIPKYIIYIYNYY